MYYTKYGTDLIAVERNVKLTSEACEHNIGKKNQLAFALNKQESCEKFKTKATIQDFRNAAKK